MADSSARLTILNGPLAGKELVLEEVVDNILIGSDGACRFHLPVPGISPIHARIWMDAAGVTIYDTHSPRGLYVNDDRVNGQAPLRNGDVLWLGTPGEDEAVMIQVRLPPRAGAPAEPAAAPEPEAVEETDSTVVMSAGSTSAPPPPTEVLEVVEELPEEAGTVSMQAPSLDAFAIAEPEPAPPEESPAEATMVMAAEDVPVLAEPESDATVVGYEPPAAAEPESDATVVGYEPQVVVEPTEAFRIAEPTPAEGEEPVKFSLDLAPSPAPEPPTFEDETTTDMAAAPPEPPTYVPAPPPEPPPPPPPPPPVAAAPPPPPPAPARAPRPAPPATPPPAPRRAAAGGGSSGALYAALGGLAFVVLAGGGYAAWRMMQGAPSGAAATPPPVTVAEAAPAPVEAAPATLAPEAPTTLAPEPVPEPPVEEAVTIVQSPPPKAASPGTAPTPRAGTPAPPKAGATPPPTTLSAEVARAQQAAAQVGTLLGKADTQAAARDFAGAAATYDEVLKLEPGNPKAGEAKAAALAAVASLKKTFVPGRTTVQSGKAAKGGISGFDSEDVSVAKAPDYSGRIDFEFSPRNVKAGDNFTILIYLTNDGKKDFKIASVSATTAVNGSRSTTPVSAPAKELSSQQRVLLGEIPGTWAAGTTSWSLDVTVTSNRNDSFRSQLTWK